MKVLISWIRDFVDVQASAEDVAERLSLRGFEVAAVEPAPDGVRPPWQARADLSDGVIDFEITANRPDCLSMIGLAREVATVYHLPLGRPSADAGAVVALKRATIGPSDRLTVSLADAELCPRYAAAVAEIAAAASPLWMRARLQAAGVRAISPIVDITNYVLLELGHPMHAFDLATLADATLKIRRAQPGELLKTLDGVERTLDPDMLVIADAHRAQAVAGVMGGAASEVSESTKVVAFESAYFKPASVRRTSKRLGLKTEASSRFERGADVNAPIVALERALALMEIVGAGRLVGPVVDVYPEPREPRTLVLRRDRIATLLGAHVSDPDVARILGSLGLGVAAADGGWAVTVPTFRVDLLREADLIEEVGRHHGFERLAPTYPVQTTPAPASDPRIERDRLLRRILTGAGLSEAVTFGFIETTPAAAFGAGGVAAIENPLSAKFAVLRPSILPGLVDAVAHNRRHGRRDARLFEIGARFTADHGETRGLGVAWTGTAVPEHWSGGAREVDFFDVKGIAEAVCRTLGVEIRIEMVPHEFLVAGQSGSVLAADGTVVGLVGRLSPAVAESRGLPRQDAVLVLELSLDRLWDLRAAAPSTSDGVVPLPRYPFVVRDLSIVVADTLPAEIIRGTIRSAGAGTVAPLVGVAFFDRYQGEGVPERAISLSVRLTFQAPDRTLTDAEVQQSFETILGALAREHAAVQR